MAFSFSQPRGSSRADHFAAASARALEPVQRHDTPACRDGQGAAVTAWAVPLRGAIPQICYRRCPGSGRVESASPP